MIVMSRKLVTLSVLSLCLFLFGCWSKNNDVENECLDWDTCSEETTVVNMDESVEEKVDNIIETNELNDENSDSVVVTDNLNWDDAMINWDNNESDHELEEVVTED